MIYLGWWGYTGMGMDVDDVKVILEKPEREQVFQSLEYELER